VTLCSVGDEVCDEPLRALPSLIYIFFFWKSGDRKIPQRSLQQPRPTLPVRDLPSRSQNNQQLKYH
jgi:hypothetical protein